MHCRELYTWVYNYDGIIIVTLIANLSYDKAICNTVLRFTDDFETIITII